MGYLEDGAIYASQYDGEISLGAGTDGQYFLLGPTDSLEATDDQDTGCSQRFQWLEPQLTPLLQEP
jgi:hypothetical protein